MQGEILAYIKHRKIPLKTKHIAAKFNMEPIDMIPILNVLAQKHLIKYQTANRNNRVDWAGWITA